MRSSRARLSASFVGNDGVAYQALYDYMGTSQAEVLLYSEHSGATDLVEMSETKMKQLAEAIKVDKQLED